MLIIWWRPSLGLIVDVEVRVAGGQPDEDVLALVEAGKLRVLSPLRVLNADVSTCSTQKMSQQ